MSRRLTSFMIAAAAVMPVLVSCGSDSDSMVSSNPHADLIGKPVDSGFRPEVDGFSFANFDVRDYPQSFDKQAFLDMVGGGPRVCIDGVTDPCVLTDEAAAFADKVNQARRAGHCEGMVVVAAARQAWRLSPATSSLKPSEAVVNAIIRAFATIFLPEVQAEARSWVEKSLSDTVAELAAALDKGRIDYGMGIYRPDGGHEVLPYAIEYPSPTIARVLVYDPNWPMVERYVDIDLERDRWRFSFAATDQSSDPYAWTGGQGDLDLNSIAVRAAALEARGVELTPPPGL
jgi:hypothetical protein